MPKHNPNPRELPTASLSLHPEASIVPEMPADQYERFLEDVKARGVLDPIELIPGTKTVIEGRTRLKAATDAKLPSVPVVDADLKGDTPEMYMLRSALLRRHLTTGQAAMLAVEIKQRLAPAAKERQREGAARGGKKKVPEIVPEPSKNGKKTDGEARVIAAQIAGTNPRYVSDAERVKEQSPELAKQVKDGTLTLPAAKRKLASETKPAKKPTAEPKPTARPAVELLPCPFCGSKKIEERPLLLQMRAMQCRECFARGPEAAEPSVARDRWNRRDKK